MIRIGFFTFVIAVSCVFAGDKQTDPPPKTDKALRARVAEFYQDHITGRFREAEPLVANDTKDYFFGLGKPKYLSCEIRGIEYSDKFTRAKVTNICEQYVNMPAFAGTPLKLPVVSAWKLEKGKWCWFVDTKTAQETPFGKMAPPSAASASEGGARMPFSIPTTADFALNKITVDRQSLTLKSGESGEVTLSNSAAGNMSVSINGKPASFEVTPEHLDLKQNGKATVTLKALPGAASDVISFRVEQTGEIIPVKVTIN